MFNQAGFTLVEILISLMLVSFMLLGFDIMQLAALRVAKMTYIINIADEQLQSMTERLAVLSSEQINQQLQLWNAQNARLLPEGKGELTQQSLTLFWGGASAKNCQPNKVGLKGCLTISREAFLS